MAPKAPPPADEPAGGGDVEMDPWETQEVVCGLVEELVDLSLVEVKESERKKALVPFVVTDVSKSIRECVGLYFVDHDVGEPSLASASNWQCGDEPVPAPVDSWSRGAVKLREREQLPEAQPDVSPEAPEGSIAASTLRSTGSRQSPRARTPSGPGGAAADGKVPILVARPPPDRVDPNAGKKKVAPIMTAAEKLKKRLNAEAKEEVERLERLKADLKGREYTYDARGNVIVMEDMHADKLPAFQQQPRLALGGGGGKKKRGKEAPAKGGARIDFGNSATFNQLDSLQPPLLESMNVQAGVLLRQGEASKGGEPRQFEGDRITKDEFEEMANTIGGFSPRRPVADAAKPAADPLESSAPASPQKAPPVAVTGQGAPLAVRPEFMPLSPPPDEKQGLRNAQMRERGGMPTKNKLPPPSLGSTVGHGQQLPYPPSPEGLKSNSEVSRNRGK